MWTVFGQGSFEEVSQWLEGIRWKKLGLLFAVPVLEYLINDSSLSGPVSTRNFRFSSRTRNERRAGGGNSTRKLVHSIHLHAFHVHDTRLDFHLEFKTRFTQTTLVIMSLELGHTTFKVIIDFLQKLVEDLEIFLEDVVCFQNYEIFKLLIFNLSINFSLN